MFILMLNLSSANCARLASNLLFDSANKDLTLDTADTQTAKVSSVTGESLTENSALTIYKDLTSDTADSQTAMVSSVQVTSESLTKNSTLTASTAKANSIPTVIADGVDNSAEIDAALATSSNLNVYKGTYFNVPANPKAGVTIKFSLGWY